MHAALPRSCPACTTVPTAQNINQRSHPLLFFLSIFHTRIQTTISTTNSKAHYTSQDFKSSTNLNNQDGSMHLLLRRQLRMLLPDWISSPLLTEFSGVSRGTMQLRQVNTNLFCILDESYNRLLSTPGTSQISNMAQIQACIRLRPK